MYVACTSVILSYCTSSATLHIIRFNQPLAHKPLPSQSSPLLRPLALLTIICIYWRSLKAWGIWRAAIITSVYLISVLLSELFSSPFTSIHLSQDLIFDSLGEVCTSRKIPLEPAKRHHKNRKRDRTSATHANGRHTCWSMPIFPEGSGCFGWTNTILFMLWGGGQHF